MFQNRTDAGHQLAARVAHLKPFDPVVVGLPRGGMIVAAEVAKMLQSPLDVLVVRKLGAPGRSELAIGAVTGGPEPVETLNDALIDIIPVSDEYLQAEIARQLEEVRRRNHMYRKDHYATPLDDRSVIIVDDGIATGATIEAGILGVRKQNPRHIVLAVPVGAPDSLERLRPLVDEIVCLHAPSNFMSVGAFYLHFDQTTDKEVIGLLEQFQTVKEKR